MSRMRSLVCVSAAYVFAGLLLRSSPASADPTTTDCLAGADRALDLRSAHKLRAAREKLLICAAASCPVDIRNECIRRLDQVNAAIPTIVFEMKDGAGNDVGRAKVAVDGLALSDRLEGTALSVDPGEHSFLFEAPGQIAVQKSFVIREAEKERHERIQFGPEGKPPEGPAPSLAMGPPVAEAKPFSPPSALAWSLMLGGAAVGVAGVVVMAVEAGQASDANRAQDRSAYNSDSKAWAAGLVASLVGAGAAAAGGIVFAASTGSTHTGASQAPVWLAVGINNVKIGGSW